jgi:hypothetical protein
VQRPQSLREQSGSVRSVAVYTNAFFMKRQPQLVMFVESALKEYVFPPPTTESFTHLIKSAGIIWTRENLPLSPRKKYRLLPRLGKKIILSEDEMIISKGNAKENEN